MSKFNSMIFCKLYLSLSLIIFLSGCGQDSQQRQYTEVISENADHIQALADRNTQSEENMRNIPDDEIHAGVTPQSQMPDDDIHRGLLQQEMPDDDIHRGLMQQMPDDDIHRGLMQQMPDDDIHAGLKGSDMNMQMDAQDPQMQQMLMNSVADAPMTWDVPNGWSAKPGSGMRMVTFTSSGEQGAIECSVISLAGSGGGLEANISRWAGQVGIQLDDQQLTDFMQAQSTLNTADAKPVKIFDFTQLQQQADSGQPSMLASVLELAQARIFIKMTGPKSAVEANKAAFQDLIRSLRIK